MDLNQKLDDIFGPISERTNKADSGHYEWRSTAGGRAKTNAQQRRKQGTRHGKNVDNAKHAAQRDVERGTFPDGTKVPEKPKNCPKCKRSDKQMIKSHDNGHDKANHHNWSWLCTACHAAKDNNQKGDNTNKGPVRNPQNDRASGKGNESGQREDIEAVAALLEAEYEPAPLEKKGQGAGDRFLAQPMKRASRRGSQKRSYTPSYGISDKYPPIQVDAHWNRTNDPSKVKYRIHPWDLGFIEATRSGTDMQMRKPKDDPRLRPQENVPEWARKQRSEPAGQPLLYRRTGMTNNSKYFVFSQPNYVDDNQILPQEESYIPPDQLAKRYHEIKAVIPKSPREGFASAKIDIQGDKVVYTEPEEIEQRAQLKVARFRPPLRHKAVEKPGSPAAKKLEPKPERNIVGKVTMMSNDQIAQFLNPSKTMIGSGAAAAAQEYENQPGPRLSQAYNDKLKDLLMHGQEKPFRIHPDVERAIKLGHFGKGLADFFRKNIRDPGRKDLVQTTTSQTGFSKDLAQATEKYFDALPLQRMQNKRIAKIMGTDKNKNKWGVPLNKNLDPIMRKVRDLPALQQKHHGKKIYVALQPMNFSQYERQEVQKAITAAHMQDQARKGKVIQEPPRYKPSPNKFKIVQLKSAVESAPDDEDRAKFRVSYVDLETGRSETVELDPDMTVYPITNLTKNLKERRPKTKKPNRRPGVAESIARAEYRNILAISEDVHEDLINPPTQRLSIEDISNLLD